MWKFEYDLNYTGGDYTNVGEFVTVPTELVEKLGEEAAFQQHTGVDPVHIIHYAWIPDSWVKFMNEEGE